MAKRQVVHQPKARQVVQDISKVDFQAPTGGGGTNLPNLRVTPTNRMMESLSGFSESITRLAAVREKNDAAKEALKARNAALTGEYQSFDRQESVDIYDQTRGDISGRSAIAGLQLDLSAIKTDIINQKLTLQESLAAFDSEKAKLIQERFGEQLGQSEAYKAGFLPHIVSGIESTRVELAKQYKENFTTETKKTQSEDIGNRVAAHTSSTPVGEGLSISQFSGFVKSGVNMGLTRKEATENAVDTIGQIALNTANPYLLDFADQADSNNFKISSNVELNTKITAYRNKARTRFNTEYTRREAAKDKLVKERGAAALKSETEKFLEDPDNYDDDAGEQRLAEEGSVTAAQTQAFFTFRDAVRKGGKDIVRDTAVYIKAHSRLTDGKMTREELDELMISSAETKSGITLDDYNRLIPVFEKHKSLVAGNNAFTIAGNQVEDSFGSDDFILSLKGEDFKPFGAKDAADLIRIKADAIAMMDKAKLYFVETWPKEPLDGKKARQFAEGIVKDLISKVEKDAKPFDELQVDLKKYGVTFMDDGKINDKHLETLKIEKTDPDSGVLGFFQDKFADWPDDLKKALKVDPNDKYKSLREKYEEGRLNIISKQKEGKTIPSMLTTIRNWYAN
jgi:hypothetical protein